MADHSFLSVLFFSVKNCTSNPGQVAILESPSIASVLLVDGGGTRYTNTTMPMATYILTVRFLLSARRVIYVYRDGLPKRIPLIEAVIFKRRAYVCCGHLVFFSHRAYFQPPCN